MPAGARRRASLSVSLFVGGFVASLAHFAVVVGHDAAGARWLLADPALGVPAVSRTALEDDWSRAGWVTLVLHPAQEARDARASL
jgi:hypothetical protein